MPPRQPIMPPRQLTMPKRTAYYASDNKTNTNKYEKGHKWVPDGSFERCDNIKMHIRSFPVVLEKTIFLEKKLLDEGSR